LAIKTDGTLWAWGSYQYGQLGDGTSGFYRGSPVQIAGTTWAQVACGENHTLAVKTDGTLWAWGFNDYGQLEGGLALQINSPVQVGQ
jgi:alpha-tubulin suppressor-like RCC1 family protein